MSTFNIVPLDASWIGVYSDDQGAKQHLYEFLRFKEPNFQPNKFSTWDGEVRLYDKKTGKCSYGLLSVIIQFCQTHKYSVDVSPEFKQDLNQIELSDVQAWCNHMDIRDNGNKIEPYDYQVQGLHLFARYSRMTLLAATAAGKSLLQYLIIRFFEGIKGDDMKVLLVVPSINLVSQMVSDFANYSSHDKWDARDKCHMVCEGANPYNSRARVIVATWQSLKDLPPAYFNQFNLLLGDECHTFSGKCLEIIGKNCINAYHRIGLTGTLRPDQLHPLQVSQHFGPIRRIVTTKQLQDAGRASKTQIHLLQLEYNSGDRKELAMNGNYQNEIEFLISHPFRNKVIKGLAKTLTGNTLMLFDRVEKHLEVIASELQQEMPDKRVLVITGKVDNDDRQLIKAEAEVGDNIILLASYGTMSTGVSVKKLHNLVFCHPSKSSIRIIQSIGRLLRLHASKDVANIYDIVDVAAWMGKQNHAMRHAAERYSIYAAEQHPISLKRFYAPGAEPATTDLTTL